MQQAIFTVIEKNKISYFVFLLPLVRLVLWVLNTTINNISYVISRQVSLNDGEHESTRTSCKLFLLSLKKTKYHILFFFYPL
jgi:hypothetical protein